MIGLRLALSVSTVRCFTPSAYRLLLQNAHSKKDAKTSKIALSNIEVESDCGCGPTVFEGKPSRSAQTINHRRAVAKLPIFKVDGSETSIDDIIGDPNENPNKTSLVVFMRSLG